MTRGKILGLSLLTLSGCTSRLIDAYPTDIERDVSSDRTYVVVSLSSDDHQEISKSGEALNLVVYPCSNRKDEIEFPLLSRDTKPDGIDRVLVKFVISEEDEIQHTIARRCAYVTSAGYSLKSFVSKPFALGARRSRIG